MPTMQEDDYRTARRRAQRFMSEQNSLVLPGYLLSFRAPSRALSEFPLGTVDVPLSKIKGTYTEGRGNAFAGNFMPLLASGTEFAEKWNRVNSAHLAEGLRDPIKAYEYLGYVYVLEGNKRVSVLLYHDAYSVRAELIRLLPERDPNDIENTIYYEFLGFDRRYVFKHLWFSKPGRYTKLRELAALYGEKHPGLEADWLEFDFFRFRKIFHKLGYVTLKMTTGDAFLEFVQLFGFPNEMTESGLAANIRHCETQFKFSLQPGGEDKPMRESYTVMFGLLAKKSKLKVGFALEGNPKNNNYAHKHYVGQRVLMNQSKAEVTVMTGLPKGADAYSALNELASKEPDILFLTDPSWELPAARLTLEYPECMVLQCLGTKPERLQATYYGLTAGPAFLAGVLSASLTRTGAAGYMRPDPESGALSGDAYAFANGARLIRPNMRVVETDDSLPDTETLRLLSCYGADIVWRPVRGLDTKNAFVGLYAQLCGLDAKGSITDIYAGACWNFGVFYETFINQILQGSQAGTYGSLAQGAAQPDYGGGLLELCSVPRALGVNPMRLLRTFAELIGDQHSIPYSLLHEKTELELLQ